MSYDPTTPAGQVRLLISDVSDEAPLFEDDEIAAFLILEGDNVKLAAARALDTIAGNEVQVAKVIKTLDLTTDGAKVGAELRLQAASLRADADSDDDFAIGEMVTNPFAYRERVYDEFLRDDAS